MICGTQEKLLPIFEKKWKASMECDRTKVLTLRHPTRLSKFKNAVPRPKYRPINHALPIWETRELDEKVPMYHGYGPKGPLVLHRGLMGNNPLKPEIGDAKFNFVLSDPYCHDVSYVYNPLHDSHLKNWVMSGKNPEFLYKQGLITKDREVVCNLKEYNEYRRFLWRKHNDLVNKKLKNQDQLDIEQNLINRANLNHKKEITKKLKHLKYIIDKTKGDNSEIPTVNNQTPKTEKSVKKSQPPLKFKKIETYTVFGLDKNGSIDHSKYKNTFIKGSQDDFYLLGFFNHLFEKKVDFEKKIDIEKIKRCSVA